MATDPSRPRRRGWAPPARYVALVLGAVLFLVPFYLLVRNGLSSEADITAPDWQLAPVHAALGQPRRAVRRPRRPDGAQPAELGGDLGHADGRRAGAVSGLAGYGLARIPYRHSNAVFYPSSPPC